MIRFLTGLVTLAEALPATKQRSILFKEYTISAKLSNVIEPALCQVCYIYIMWGLVRYIHILLLEARYTS
jgi:hypothetical protein